MDQFLSDRERAGRCAPATGAEPGDVVLFLGRPRRKAASRPLGALRPGWRRELGLDRREGRGAFSGSSTFRCSIGTRRPARWTRVHHPFTAPSLECRRLRPEPRGRCARRTSRPQRRRARRRQHPYPPAPTCSGGSSTLLGMAPARPRSVRLPAARARLRRAAARRHRARHRPHGDAARRRDSIREVIAFPKTQRAGTP